MVQTAGIVTETRWEDSTLDSMRGMGNLVVISNERFLLVSGLICYNAHILPVLGRQQRPSPPDAVILEAPPCALSTAWFSSSLGVASGGQSMLVGWACNQ